MLQRWKITIYGCACEPSLKRYQRVIEAENEADAKRQAQAVKDNLIKKGYNYRKARVTKIK